MYSGTAAVCDKLSAIRVREHRTHHNYVLQFVLSFNKSVCGYLKSLTQGKVEALRISNCFELCKFKPSVSNANGDKNFFDAMGMLWTQGYLKSIDLHL